MIDPRKVPAIFLTETLLVSAKMVVEEDFQPIRTGTDLALTGLVQESMPNLKGYILTFPKRHSRTLLTSRKGDPLLSTWR